MKILSIPYKVKFKSSSSNKATSDEYVCLVSTDNQNTYILNIEVMGNQFTHYYLLMNDGDFLHDQFKYMRDTGLTDKMEIHLLEELCSLTNRKDIIQNEDINNKEFNQIYWTKEGWNTYMIP